MKSNNNLFIYNTSLIGKIGIAEIEGYITRVYFYNELQYIQNIYNVVENKIIYNCFSQILDYLEGRLEKISSPIKLEGSKFMKLVWSELLNIPYAELRTYKELAIKIGNSNYSRAIGHANNKNPIPIIVPCHRVIGSNGKMIGYRGGIELKERLIKMENPDF